MANSKYQDDKNKYKGIIFTKETLGITLCVFSAMLLIILFTRSLIFGDVGNAICSFALGAVGFCAYPILCALLYSSVKLVSGKESKFSFAANLFIILTCLFTALIAHSFTVSSYEYESFNEYVSLCSNAANTSTFSSTALGAVGAFASYYVIDATTVGGSYIVFTLLAVLFGYVSYTLVRAGKKQRPKKRKKSEKEIKGYKNYPVDVNFDEIRRGFYPSDLSEADYVNDNGTYYPSGEYAAQNTGYSFAEKMKGNSAFNREETSEIYEGNVNELDNETKKNILFGGGNEAYMNNLIFDKQSSYNNRRSLRSRPNYDSSSVGYKGLGGKSDGVKREFGGGSYLFNDSAESKERSYLNDYQSEKDGASAYSAPQKIFSDETREKREFNAYPNAPLSDVNRRYGSLNADGASKETSKPDELSVKRESPFITDSFDSQKRFERPEAPAAPENTERRSFARDAELDRRLLNKNAETPLSERGASVRENNSLFGGSGLYGASNGGLRNSENSVEPENGNNSRISDNSRLNDSSRLNDNPRISDNSRIADNSRLNDNSRLSDGSRLSNESNGDPAPVKEERGARFGRLSSGNMSDGDRISLRRSLLEGSDKKEGNYFSSNLNFNLDKSAKSKKNAAPVQEESEDVKSFLDFEDEENEVLGADFGAMEDNDDLLPPVDEDSPFDETPPSAPERYSRRGGFERSSSIRENRIPPVAPVLPANEDRKADNGNSARAMGVFGNTDFTVHREYVRPPMDLFVSYPQSSENSEEEVENSKRGIIERLGAFNIQAEICSVTRGPTFTRYDVKVPINIPSKKVIGYATEIAMALHSKDGVNIFANLENGTNSIEVPNKSRVTVGLRSIMESKEFKDAKADSLTFAIGKNVEGKSVCGRIAKMTHLLVAGSTGAGKSCFLNSLLLSLIVKYTPQELRLILIDPKKIEFSIYNNLPHLMVNEIITDATKVIATLNWAIDEMERRYMLFSQMMNAGTLVRNIDEYNAAVRSENEKIPKLVIVVDELADLMSVAKKDIEDRISRLAAKSRACGIHLIIATQRPSVDVITGVIKSNLPTRFAFKVAADVDSRIILDDNGAEKLLGNGDLLYKTAQMFSAERVQGAFVSSEEVQKVVEYIKANNETYYDPTVADIINSKMREAEADEGEGESLLASSNGSVEPVYIDSLRLVVEKGTASISMIQRKFSVGYNKAGRIIEWMEEMGYVSAFNGAKSRSVLLTKEEFEEKYGNGGGASGAAQDEDF